jgi:hypothetical protein
MLVTVAEPQHSANTLQRHVDIGYRECRSKIISAGVILTEGA